MLNFVSYGVGDGTRGRGVALDADLRPHAKCSDRSPRRWQESTKLPICRVDRFAEHPREVRIDTPVDRDLPPIRFGGIGQTGYRRGRSELHNNGSATAMVTNKVPARSFLVVLITSARPPSGGYGNRLWHDIVSSGSNRAQGNSDIARNRELKVSAKHEIPRGLRICLIM